MSLRIRQDIRRGSFALQVELDLPARGTTAIFGASGSGKSSLLRAVAGLDRHPGGLVQVQDRIWQDERTFVPVHQRKLAYVFQEDNLFPHLDVWHNLRFGSVRAGTSEARLRSVVDLLQIGPLLRRKPAQLSGGERQKVAIARALALQPELLLLDEPLAGVDAAFRESFLPQLRTLIGQLDTPVLYVSHAADEVAQLADTLVLFEPGQAPCAGDLVELLTSPRYSLATRQDAESVIDATVLRHDAAWGLLELGFSGGILTVPGPALPAGQRVRARVFAQDVSVVLQAPAMTSILNLFPATVLQLLPGGEAQVVLLLQVGAVSETGGQRLLARITRKSAAHLDLHAGSQVYAQIKSVAVLR